MIFMKDVKGIIFDTSFLLEAFKTPGILDSLSEEFPSYEYLVPVSVINELKGIVKSDSGRRGNLARLVLDYISKGRFRVIGSIDSDADRDILMLSMDSGYFVATGDKVLRNSLLEKGVKIVYIKDGYLHII